MASDTTWQSLGKAKLSSINSSIPARWRLSSIPSIDEQRDVTGTFVQKSLSKEEIEITETDAVGIVEKTHAGIWAAEDVAAAFCHRASIAHQLTNCLHETFFNAAIEDAKRLDKYYAQHKAPIGPLHGLPVSLKDQFHVKGVETSMGVSYVFIVMLFSYRFLSRDTCCMGIVLPRYVSQAILCR